MNVFMIEGSIQCSVGEASQAIRETLDAWQLKNNVQRLWDGDTTIWTHRDENKWLGWLGLDNPELCEFDRIHAVARDIRDAGFSDIVLLGMGGSSLFPDMMARTFGTIDHWPCLHILDSTDPIQIEHLENKINLKKTVFIVSSKSGSTLEPNILKAYFEKRLKTVHQREDVGNFFVIITDPHSTLEIAAKSQSVRAIFHGLPTIGGRYSALSHFGMVPSGMMGVDINTMMQHAKTMADACASKHPVAENPGALLGIVFGVCAKQGKDKITLIISPSVNALGAWIEQLLAESTGKKGNGLIPIDNEPLGPVEVYGTDRLFVYIRLVSDPDPAQDRLVDALEKAGHVVVRCLLDDKMHVGAEIFRWEMATAVAGSVLGINPFDQPDVEASKIRTSELMKTYEATGDFPQNTPIFSQNGIQLFTDDSNARDLRDRIEGEPSIETYLRAHFSRVQSHDYVDISAFIEMSKSHVNVLQDIRTWIRDTLKVATCVGFGPRFLHSTGQLYKGGANSGVFLQITTDHHAHLEIPNKPYTFDLVLAAAAQGDFEVLTQRSRRALRIHLAGENLENLHAIIFRALNNIIEGKS